MKGAFQRVNEKLEKHKNKNALIVPLINILTQVAAKADPNAIAKILELLS